MNNAVELKQALIAFRKKVDETLRNQRISKTENMRRERSEMENLLKSIVLSTDLVSVIHAFSQMVRFERDRYAVPEMLETPDLDDVVSPAVENGGDAAVEAKDVDQDGEKTPSAPPATPAETAPAGPPPTMSPMPQGSGPFTRGLASDLGSLWRHSVEGAAPHDRFSWLFDHELNNMTSETGLLQNVGAQFVPKLKKAADAVRAGRVGDALIVLKTTLRNDPHNHTLAFLVSQLLYLQAGKGQRNAHPEARDLAQRSMIPNEKLPDEVLTWYRYHSICCEISHSPERALEWLRDTDMLNPNHLMHQDGWLAHDGGFIKSWILLSKIPVEMWGEREMAALNDLVWHVVGGGALYLTVFRPLLMQALSSKKDLLPQIEELDGAVNVAYQYYLEIAPNMEKLVQTRAQAPWLVRTRLLQVLASMGGRPAFDHVLLHITLDGESWQEGVFPDGEIQSILEDSTVATWRWWAMAVTPLREPHQQSVLPTAEAEADMPLASEAEVVLGILAKEEQMRMRDGVWDKIADWMVRWQLDHLLAAGSGTNKPRMKFMPSLPPYSHFYRRWSDPSPSGILASQIIAENAKHGAFANWYEVLAAFEGAWRLIDDPVHGLVAMQKRALATAKAQDPNRYAGLTVTGAGIDFSKFGFILVPLGMAAGVIVAVSMTRNIGQAIGVILVLAGLAGVMAIQLTKQR